MIKHSFLIWQPTLLLRAPDGDIRLEEANPESDPGPQPRSQSPSEGEKKWAPLVRVSDLGIESAAGVLGTYESPACQLWSVLGNSQGERRLLPGDVFRLGRVTLRVRALEESEDQSEVLAVEDLQIGGRPGRGLRGKRRRTWGSGTTRQTFRRTCAGYVCRPLSRRTTRCCRCADALEQ